MTTPWIIGVGQTRFDGHPGRTVADLAFEAIAASARDAEVPPESVDAVFFANSLQGYHEEQHCIRGQVALQRTALEGKPIVNVENACASGSTALHLATLAFRAAQYRRVLAVGVDKLAVADPVRMIGAFGTAVDVAHRDEQIGALLRLRADRLAAIRRERPELARGIPAEAAGGNRTVFMDGARARRALLA